MAHRPIGLLLAATLAATAQKGYAQDGNIAAGHAFAREDTIWNYALPLEHRPIENLCAW